MITKFSKYEKLFESLPRQSTVNQLKRIRDEINKSQEIIVGPEHTYMKGDVGDRVIDDLVKHKGKQEMNNLFWWDNPLDRHIDSYETFVRDDNKDSLGYTKDAKEKPNTGVDIPNRPEDEVPKPKKKTLGKQVVKEDLDLTGVPEEKIERHEKSHGWFIRRLKELGCDTSVEELEKMGLEQLGRLFNQYRKK